MIGKLEHRFNGLIHEIKEIKKQVLWGKLVKTEKSKKKLNRWKTLGDDVSSKWHGPPAVEEIREQREKFDEKTDH
jgi:hypothetical protein